MIQNIREIRYEHTFFWISLYRTIPNCTELRPLVNYNINSSGTRCNNISFYSLSLSLLITTSTISAIHNLLCISAGFTIKESLINDCISRVQNNMQVISTF